MSVVPMKLLTITGPANLIDDVICTCLVNEQFHPVEASRVSGGSQNLPVSWSNQWKELLSTAEDLMETMDIPKEFLDFRQETLTMDLAKSYLDEVSAHLGEVASQREDLKRRIEDNAQDVEDLNKFLQLPSDLEEIYHLNYVRFRFGRMPREAYNACPSSSPKSMRSFSIPTQVGQDYAYLVYITPKNRGRRNDNLMSTLGFERMRLTGHTLGTPEETAHMLEEDSRQCEGSLAALEQDYATWLSDQRQKLQLTYSYIRFLYEAGEIKKYATQTLDGSFTLYGWVPASETDRVTARLSAFPDLLSSAEDPEQVKDEEPPVLLKNNFWARLFQPFTEMYGLPTLSRI